MSKLFAASSKRNTLVFNIVKPRKKQGYTFVRRGRLRLSHLVRSEYRIIASKTNSLQPAPPFNVHPHELLVRVHFFAWKSGPSSC